MKIISSLLVLTFVVGTLFGQITNFDDQLFGSKRETVGQNIINFGKIQQTTQKDIIISNPNQVSLVITGYSASEGIEVEIVDKTIEARKAGRIKVKINLEKYKNKGEITEKIILYQEYTIFDIKTNLEKEYIVKAIID